MEEDENQNNSNTIEDKINSITQKARFDEFKERLKQVKRKAIFQEELNEEDLMIASNDPRLRAYISYLERLKTEENPNIRKELDRVISEFEKEALFEENQDINSSLAQRSLFESKRRRVLKGGGKEIIHLTDSECDSKDLEAKIIGVLQSRGKEKFDDSDIVVHTGDMLSSFFDAEKFGQFDMFLSKNLIKQGRLEGKIAGEFLEDYTYLLEKAGFSEEDIRLKKISSNEELQKIQTTLMGYFEPSGMTEKEKIEFLKIRERFLKNLRTGIKNWASEEYRTLREVTDKYGLNENNFALISGNHDVPEEMRKYFSDVMPNVGDTREINGIKFGYGLDTSTGAVMGKYLNDLFGSQDITEIKEDMFYKSEGFTKIKRIIDDDTRLNLTNDEVLSLAKREVQKSKYLGMPSIVNEYLNEIGEETEKNIRNKLKEIEEYVPKDCDALLNHSFPSHPKHAGLSDRFYKSVVDKRVEENPNLVLINGHIHDNTSGLHGGVYQLNSGSFKNGNFGVYLFDKDKRFTSVLSRSIDKLHGNEYEFRHQNSYELSGSKDSGNNSMN